MAKQKPSKKKNKKGDDKGNQEEIQRRALIETASHLQKDIEKEDVALNEYKTQIEQMKQNWDLNKFLLENKKKKYTDKVIELQIIKQKNSKVIHDYKQQLKNLLLNHQENMAETKTESEKKRNISNDDRRKEELELTNDIYQIDFTQKEKQIAHVTFLFQLKEKHNHDTSNLLKECTRSSRGLFVHHDIKLKNKRKDLECDKLNEIQMIELEYCEQVKQLMQVHAIELKEIKHHYNNVIENILFHIKDLKQQMVQLKIIERQTDRNYNKATTQNLRTKIPQQSAEKDIHTYQADLERFYKIQHKLQELQHSEILLWKKQKQLYETTWRYEILYQKYVALQSEYNDYHNQVEKVFVSAQQESSLSHVLLERKLGKMILVKEAYNASLIEVLNRSDISIDNHNKNNNKNNKTHDYTSDITINNRQSKESNVFVKNILQVKNTKIGELEFILQQIQKDHRQFKKTNAS